MTTRTLETSAGTVEVHLARDARFGVGVRVDHENFCPGEERVTLTYAVEDPDADVQRVVLELWGTKDDQPHKLCYLGGSRGDAGPDGRDWAAPGEHTFAWGGEVLGALSGARFEDAWRGARHLGADDLPDGLATVEFSPYRLKVLLYGAGTSASGSATVRVEVHSVELELGWRELVPQSPDDRDLDVWRQFRADSNHLSGRALPQPACAHRTQRLLLEGNCYKTRSEHMLDADMLHDRYRNLWTHADGVGPRLPITAFVFVKSAGGRAVDAPRALGRVQLLWDWEVVSTDTTDWFRRFQGAQGVSANLNQAGAEFIDATLDYDVQATRPPGNSCHADRGGKRGSTREQVLLPLDGFDFARPTARTWGALTAPRRDGQHERSRAGVLFSPSHIAGDCYRLRVHVAWYVDERGRRVSLDVVDGHERRRRRAPGAVTGNLQVWRRVDLVRYRAKTAALAAEAKRVDVRWVAKQFQMAFVQLIPRIGGEDPVDVDLPRRPAVMRPDEFDRHLAQAAEAYAGELGREGPLLRRALADSQHASGNHGVSFVDFDAWRARLATTPYDDGAGRMWTLDRLCQQLGVTGATTSARTAALRETYYNSLLKGWADALLERVAGRYARQEKGLHLFHYEGMHDQLANDTSGWTWWGIAPNIGRRMNQAAFNLYAPAGSISHTRGRDFVVAHEIGHLMHLCHAADGHAGGGPTERALADRLHDRRSALPWQTGAGGTFAPTPGAASTVPCIMGYEHGRYEWFCAMCNLRLRGWKVGSLSNDHPLNRRAGP